MFNGKRARFLATVKVTMGRPGSAGDGMFWGYSMVFGRGTLSFIPELPLAVAEIGLFCVRFASGLSKL